MTYNDVAIHQGKNWVFEYNSMHADDMLNRRAEHPPKEGTY